MSDESLAILRRLALLASRVPHGFVVVLLLAAFAASGTWSLGQESATYDETAHLPAGLSYLERWDFRLNPEHPPLAKLWAALPVYALGMRGDYDSPAWRGRARALGRPRTAADQWLYGFELLNGKVSAAERRDPFAMLVPARLAMLLLGVFLGLLVYAWARALFGVPGSLVSLFLYSLCPTMLAHTRLVTTDLAAALGMVAALFAFRQFLVRPGALWLALCGLAAGAALLAKFSALLLGPMLLAGGLAWALSSGSAGVRPRRRAAVLALGWVATALVAFAVLWAGYGFRRQASSDPAYELDWKALEKIPGGLSPAVRVAREAGLLPEAYLYGMAFVASTGRRAAFLDGEVSEVGWWSYFPEAFALKSPPALLLLLAWALSSLVRDRRRSFDLWYLLGPAALYFAFSVATRFNIGHRHLAPLYPLLFVLCGRVAELARARRFAYPAVALLLSAYAGSFAAATPRYLSYFNSFAGGSANGWRHLCDSNVDWGQDLPRLKQWMEDNGIPEVYLAYFGTADPRAHGVRYQKVAMVPDLRPEEPQRRPRSGDVLAVSVNLLQGLYLEHDFDLGMVLYARGRVSPAALREFDRQREQSTRGGERFPRLADWLVRNRLAEREEVDEAASRLLTSWLAGVRDNLRPIGRAGDSILAYRIP
ncbi:MAG: glycosyltransferase family 39 protein [Myxococcales bacterium]|nr:glycosyltransferase family 39 protein [Myxococcales bacterium]